MMDNKTVLFLVVLIAAAVCIGPLLILWALNTLFEQAGSGAYVPHNFWTYLAVIVLGGVFSSGAKSGK